ncbi:MAG: methylated-DNA--[protein]-cysteine S-methyltransferase [Kiloniellaceae bacterium]
MRPARAPVRAAQGSILCHARVETPLGQLVLSAREDAIVRIAWASAAAESADAPGANALLRRATHQLGEYFAGRRRAFELALDPPGTPFQRRVWAEMAKIPWGETATYGDLARRLGSAARPVGQACGANPIPILIPCHRVLAGDGGLGGYSGGAGPATKAALLALEGARAATPHLFAAPPGK